MTYQFICKLNTIEQTRLKQVYKRLPSHLTTFRLLYEAKDHEETHKSSYDLENNEHIPDPTCLPLETVVFFKFYEPTWVYLIIESNFLNLELL